MKGENHRTDWFVEKLYVPKGFFTPPFETTFSLKSRLSSLYVSAEIETAESMACFRCKRAE